MVSALARVSIPALCSLLIACAPPPREDQGTRYELRGKIVSVDKNQRQVVVDHEEIPGFMAAMTMPFKLKSDWAFDQLSAGDRLQATLVVADSGFWLEEPIITKGMPTDSASGASSSGNEPRAGDEVPDFSLINQDGKTIHLSQYRGRALAVTFIYTRCPLSDYCPLMSANFAEISRALQQAGVANLGTAQTHLLSVTIDPAHDTPQVLRSYGAAHTEKYLDEKFQQWEFATGAPEEIKRMAQFFGLSFYEEKDQIIHSLRTAVIAPDGRIFKIYRGNEWKTTDVLRDLQILANMLPS